MDHSKLWKILKEMGIPDHLTCLLRNSYVGQEATVRSEYGKKKWSKLRKEYKRTAYRHTAFLTYMKGTACEMPGWMNYKLESRLSGEISTTSDMQPIPLSWHEVKRN